VSRPLPTCTSEALGAIAESPKRQYPCRFLRFNSSEYPPILNWQLA